MSIKVMSKRGIRCKWLYHPQATNKGQGCHICMDELDTMIQAYGIPPKVLGVTKGRKVDEI